MFYAGRDLSSVTTGVLGVVCCGNCVICTGYLHSVFCHAVGQLKTTARHRYMSRFIRSLVSVC